MLNVLVKKQLKEVFRAYYINRKSGKGRSKAGIAGMFILFMFLLALLSLVFLFLASNLCKPLASAGLVWLYFSIMGLVTISLGVVGSVFNSYEALFHARDNEALLSMPIKPSYILISRMISVFVLALLYGGIVWLPTVLVYATVKDHSLMAIVLSCVLWPFITLFVTVATCLLGWIVALVSRKIKHKNIVITVLSIVVFGAYYYFCANISNVVNNFILNSEEISDGFAKYGNIVYLLGKGAEGDVLSFALFIAITVLAFAITTYLMSKTFGKIATYKDAATDNVKVSKKETKQLPVKKALLKRELLKFTSSPTYMLNGGMGIVFGPAVAIIGIIKMDTIRSGMNMIAAELPGTFRMIPFFVLALVCFIFGMNLISAPSISLEGKSLWLAKSLPIKGKDFLEAKENLHVSLNIYPAIFTMAVFAWIVMLEPVEWILLLAYLFVFIRLNAVVGLWLGIKNPNFEWTNESVPIKQSSNVFVEMVLNMLVVGITLLLGYLIKTTWCEYVVIGGMAVLIEVIERLTSNWLYKNADRLLKAL